MLDNYQDLIDELLGTPKLVRAALTDGDPVAMRLVEAMRARDLLVLERCQRIKNQIDPHLKELPALDDLLAAANPGNDSAALLDAFETARGDLVSLLMNLTLRDWERTATHDSGDVITLADEVESHVEFDEERRAQLDSLGA
jgi:hypothetical protein